MEDNINTKNKEERDWEKTGIKVLDMAKQELFLGMRYMFLALNMLGYKADRRIRFVATDGRFLYYNPVLLIENYKKNPTDVNRAYLHMIMHCLFRHIYDAEKYKDEDDIQLWNLSCDICAEYLVDGIELSCVIKPENTKRQQIYKEILDKSRVLSAANIFYILKTQMNNQAQMWIASGEFEVDDHAYWHADQSDKDNRSSDEDNNKQEEKWENAAKKMQSAMTFDSGRGDTKGNLLKMLKAVNPKEISYRDFLRKFAVTRESMHVDMDSFDYGFYNYGMTVYGNMPLIEELEYREESRIKDFVIVIDTSGSCAFTLVQKFINETLGILTESDLFFEKIRLHIIQCDNQVQEDIVINDLKQAESFKDNFAVKGFGGTDFRPAFNYIEKLRQMGELKSLKGVLYFTDGYGIYPEHKPSYDVAFVFPEMYDADRIVPGWAIRVEWKVEE